MSKQRKRSKAYYAKRNYSKGTTKKSVTEYNDIWHWNDKTKRRFKVVKPISLIEQHSAGIMITLIDNRPKSHKLLSDFEVKWRINIQYSDELVRQDIRDRLIEYPNKNAAPPKKKLFERSAVYQKRCSDFKWVSIEPSEDVINNEFRRWKADQQKAINSDEYKQLKENVKRQRLHAQKQNKIRYLNLIEINTFDDDNDMKNNWAEIRKCCEKGESLKKHYLSLQVDKENAWLAEKEKKKRLKENREKLRKKQIAEKKAMLARANKESRQLGAKIKFRLRRDHNCPYCNGELGTKPHADHTNSTGWIER